MKKTTLTIFVVLSSCMLLLSGIWIYFQKSLETADLEKYGKIHEYKKHYVLIQEQENSMVWNQIYSHAQQWAEGSDAYLERISIDEENGYTLKDCLNISIASKADGIILKPDGTEQVRKRINEATEQGIPVVTVLEDDSESKRISFVGLNSYQLGDTYTEQASRFLGDGETDILVLLPEKSRDAGMTLSYAQILKSLEGYKTSSKKIRITSQNVDVLTDFAAEEAVRDVFVNVGETPDILICLDEVLTECACQAIVDHNQVGNMTVIGFYYSANILDALSRGVMPVTVALDTKEIGQYCINALEEFHLLGHTSSYYSVDVNLITAANAEQFLNQAAAEDKL